MEIQYDVEILGRSYSLVRLLLNAGMKTPCPGRRGAANTKVPARCLSKYPAVSIR